MAGPKVVKKVKRYPGAEALVALDPWLEPYAAQLQNRFEHYQKFRVVLDDHGGPTGEMTTGHLYFGLNRGKHEGKEGVWYREWAPGAKGLSLVGDFNGWSREANKLTRDQWGVWSVFLSDEEYAGRLRHGSKIKVHVVGADGTEMFRIPAYIRRVVQEESKAFIGEYWNPPAFAFKHKGPGKRKGALRVYEAHVGMATEQEKVGTFKEFTANVLPRIAELHYNAVQLMAIQEHPYYGSFGYHVSSFFAVSSRFGTPEDLKELIDTAHGMGISVIMDLVHSHAVKNVEEGLNRFDGTDHQYFHAGVRGEHVAWDSLVFDYSKYEVQRFLLSNVRYWLEEFRFDGFRFDGVTSMLYLDHGLGKNFTSYEDYFTLNTDGDAVAYLQLANDVAHAVRKGGGVVTIAEDMSGMPGLARPTKEGGLGFDYRLAMGVPDYWIKTLKEKSDEQWRLNDIYGTLLNRRQHEKHLGYSESHDQALVGDKTLAFWLMDKEMYFSMSKATPSLVVDRGMALHKMIRLITFALSGEGYLNFMGNEFGHPEWIDFPRLGNHWSYKHARRQWNLVDDPMLKYRGLNEFDRAMQMLDEKYGVLEDVFIEQLACHEDTKQLVFRRGPLVFAFNFHATESYVGLRIPVPDAKDYRVVLDTDAEAFGGQGRVPEKALYPRQSVPMYGRGQSVQLYLPARTAQVLAPV